MKNNQSESTQVKRVRVRKLNSIVTLVGSSRVANHNLRSMPLKKLIL